MTQVKFAPAVTYQRGAMLNSSMFYMGSLQSFLAKGEDTGGRFALMEYQAKPGNEPPPHSHELSITQNVPQPLLHKGFIGSLLFRASIQSQQGFWRLP